MATLNKVVVDLEDYTSGASQVFSGRPRGTDVRTAAGLAALDKQRDTIVEIHIPEDAYTVTSSFFLGMLGKSIETLGEEGFREKYHFRGWDVSRLLEESIVDVLSGPGGLY